MTTCMEVENYGHPGSHPPAIITQDSNNRFVTDAQIVAWDAKVDQDDYDVHVHTLLRNPADTLTGVTVESNGAVALLQGVAIDEFSTDAALSGESDTAVPTEKAVKDYVDDAIDAYIPYRLSNPSHSIPDALVIDAVGRATFPLGVGINRFSADGTLASNSDDYVPTEKAVKTYVDGEVADNAVNIAANAAAIVVAGGDIDDLEAKFTAGISQTLTFTGGATGAVATMTLVDGLVTAVTLVP